MLFDHCRDLFRGELSISQVILQNIHLRTENTSGLCGVFDKNINKKNNKKIKNTIREPK